jgi:predicted ABC-type ATPase
MVFLWLPSADFAVARVAERVRMGGHDVPEETIRRRYNKGIENFFRLYRPMADTWRIYDNSARTGPRLVADGGTDRGESIYGPETWSMIRGERNERS